MQRAIEAAAGGFRLELRHFAERRRHDAQIMATLMPMGMIFVPSIGGMSHSPREFTSGQDCANGAIVLFKTVLLETVRTLARG